MVSFPTLLHFATGSALEIRSFAMRTARELQIGTQPDCWRGLDTEQSGRLNPALTGNDRVIFINQNWIVESELFDAVGDLANLFLRMGPRVAGTQL
jgi:hypothetical protein